jgi:hypothetical protein
MRGVGATQGSAGMKELYIHTEWGAMKVNESINSYDIITSFKYIIHEEIATRGSRNTILESAEYDNG